MHETRLRPLARAYSNAKRMIRSEPSGLSGLIEIPELPQDLLLLAGVEEVDHGVRVVGARLELDPGVEVLGVLADDDEVDALVARAHARVRLAGPDARVEAELVAQRDVHGAEPGADRRRDRALERDAVALDRLERLLRERRPGLLHHVDARLLDVPLERDAGRLEDAARRLGELGAGSVAGNRGSPCATSGGRIVAGPGSPVRYRPSHCRPRRKECDERLQAGSRRRRRRRDRDRRARPRGRRPPLPRHRHRGARRDVPVRERLGAPRRRRPRLRHARPRGRTSRRG